MHLNFHTRTARYLQRTSLIAFVLGFATLLSGSATQYSKLEQIKAAGVLRVATVNSQLTYYIGPDGPEGFDYELIRGFANDLGINFELTVPPTIDGVYAAVEGGHADVGAAHLPVELQRADDVSFSAPYSEYDYYVIYRKGDERPRKVTDLADKQIHVRAKTATEDDVSLVIAAHPDLQWITHESMMASELVERVAVGDIDYAVVRSSAYTYVRRMYPNLGVAFVIGDSVRVSWAFRADSDDSLRTAFNNYLQRSRMNGEFAAIWDRQFGRTNVFEHVDSRTFMRHFKRRLPRYQNEFQATAERYGLDWRLLAALSYQESHWNSKAVSPTGVKGLMMLTSNTASSLGVDRHDASQSIDGAARYLVRLQARMPSRIAEPDRTWFTLAAYNVGYGHLEDARRLTQQHGGNPDHWADVARNLPLLSRPEWHSKTRHGYARGGEPVYFVRNIRHYYDALVWLDYRTARGDPANRMLAVTDSATSSVM